MHQHGIVFAVVQEPGGYESWTDICKPDGKFLDVSQLLQRIDVSVLETFGGRVGRSSPQSFGSRNGTDDGKVSSFLLGKVAESGCHHAHKSGAVGLQRAEFDFRCQLVVLVADARAVQVEVHASHFFNQFQQTVSRILLTDVNGPDVDTLRSQSLQFFQVLFTPACQSEYPSLLEQLQGRFFSDAGSSPYDEGTLYRFLIHQLVRIS